MLSRKGTQISVDDDLGAKLLINNIFGETMSNMDLPSFCNALKFETPLINSVIRRYFAGKFTETAAKIKLPIFSQTSQIIND